MARTQIAVTNVNRAGVVKPALVATDAVNFNALGNDGKTILEAKNTDAAQQTLTLRPTTLVDGQAVSPRVVTIAAGATKLIGPFPTADYSAQVQIDSSSALIQVAAYRLS